MFASKRTAGYGFPDCLLLFLVPGGEVESPCLAAAVFETATSTDSVTPARDVAA